MKKPLEILVVDDNPKYLDAAKQYFDSQDNLNVTYISNSKKELDFIDTTEIDGALLDVFMPIKDKESIGLTEKEISLIKKLGNYDDEEVPIGVIAGERLESKGVPYLLVTDFFHHARKFEPVNQYLEDKYGVDKSKILKEGGKEAYARTIWAAKPSNQKDKPAYWEDAYKKLKAKLKI